MAKKPVAVHDTASRKRLAEYLLRHPFSLQKITWYPTTQTVIYRSKRHHTTKRNFEIFETTDFLAAVIDHIPPKGQQTVRYYGLYSNKCRGLTSPIPTRLVPPPEDCRPGCQGKQASPPVETTAEILLIPPPKPRMEAP